MTTQFATPLLLRADRTTERLRRLPLGAGGGDSATYDEAWLAELIFTHPELLPIREIDAAYANPVPICVELPTRAGPLDVLYLTASGRLVIAEAKLWRNPEARRKVIGQILDYAAELTRWTYADLEREVAKRRGSGDLFGVVTASQPGLDEADFVDSVSRSLREGRFLLLVCGDGIREELTGIAEFLERYTSLDLTFGLVELAIFASERGDRFVQPRVLAKTLTICRHVVRIEGGHGILEQDAEDGPDGDRLVRDGDNELLRFWSDLAQSIKFDDPSQQPPRPSKTPTASLPMPSASAWVRLYVSANGHKNMDVRLGFNRCEPGDTFYRRLLEEREQISASLPPGLAWESDGTRHSVSLSGERLSISHPVDRAEAIRWLSKVANLFVNAFRPRIARYQEEL